MRESKWNFYINSLQGHPSVAMTDKSANGLSFLLDYIPIGKILCIGCADGAEVAALKELGYHAVGITLGKNNVKYGKEKFKLTDEELMVMDMVDLDFESESFDGAYSCHAFEHAFSPWMHVLEVNAILKDAGLWWSQYPKCDLSGKEGDCFVPSHHHPNVCYMDIHLNLLECCGFDIKYDEVVGGEFRWLAQKNSNKDIHEGVRGCLNIRKKATF